MLNVELPHNIDYGKSLYHFDNPQYMLLYHQFFHKLDIRPLRGVKAGYTSINPLRNIEKMHSSVSYFTTTPHVLAKFMIFLSNMMNLLSRYHGNTIAWCIAWCTVICYCFLHLFKNPDRESPLFFVEKFI